MEPCCFFRVKEIGHDSPLKPRSFNTNGFTPKKVTPVGTLFHPSNIKFSSTPKGKGTPRKSSPIPLDLSAEGVDSPIHGHLQNNRSSEKKKARNTSNEEVKAKSPKDQSAVKEDTTPQSSRSEEDIIREHQEIMNHLDVVLDKAKSVMQKTNIVASEESKVVEEEEDEMEEEQEKKKTESSLETACALLRELRATGQPMQAKRISGNATFDQSEESKSQPDVREKEDLVSSPPQPIRGPVKGGLLNMLRAREKEAQEKEAESSSDAGAAIRRWHLSDPFPVGLRRGPMKRTERTQSSEEERGEEKHVLKSLTEIRKMQSAKKATEAAAGKSLGDERPFNDLLASPSNTRQSQESLTGGRQIPILVLKASEVEALKTKSIATVVSKGETTQEEPKSVSDSGIGTANGITKSRVTFVNQEEDHSEASTLNDVPPIANPPPPPTSASAPPLDSPQSQLTIHQDSAFTKVSVSSQEIDLIRQNALSQGIVLSDTSGNSSYDLPKEYKRSPVRSDRPKMNSADSVFSPIVAFPVTPGDQQEITVPCVTKLEVSDEIPDAVSPFMRKSQENVSRMLEKQLKKLKDEMATPPSQERGNSTGSDISVEEDEESLLQHAQWVFYLFILYPNLIRL
jgi:hypothetical protein